MFAAVLKYAQARVAACDVFSRSLKEKKAPFPIMERQFLMVESMHMRNSSIESAKELYTHDKKKLHIFNMVVKK